MTRPGQPKGGAPVPRRTGRSGFTLVEILLALAVIALMASLLLPGVGAILRSMDNQEPRQVLWDAVTAARERALTLNREVLLSFDPEKRVLTWNDGTEAKVRAWPAGVKLEFLRPKEGATILLGGQLVETETIRTVRFFPDGTCDRFRVQLRSGTEPAQVIAIDPWTCAPMIGPEVAK